MKFKYSFAGIVASSFIALSLGTTNAHAAAPSAPVFSKVTTPYSTSAQLEWNSVEGAVKYEILRDGVSLGTVDAPGLMFGDFNVTPLQTYTYSLVAINDLDEKSEPVTVTKKIAGSDASLSYLMSPSGEFDQMISNSPSSSQNTETTLFVLNGTETISIHGTTGDQYSTILINGKQVAHNQPTELNVATIQNEVDIDVTAADGIAKKHYDVHVKPYINLDKSVLKEATLNDGSIAGTINLHFNKKTFNEDITGVTVQNLPAGITADVQRKSDQDLTISFKGKAIVHEAANSINNAFVSIPSQVMVNGYLGGEAYKSDAFKIEFANKAVSPVIPAISNPSKLNVSPSINHIVVHWDKVANATSYEVRRNGVKVYEGSSINFLDKGLYSDTRYTYTVIAKNKTGKSTGVSVVTKTLPQKYQKSSALAKQYYAKKDFVNALRQADLSISLGDKSSDTQKILTNSWKQLKERAYILAHSNSKYNRTVAKSLYKELLNSKHVPKHIKQDANFGYKRLAKY